MDLERIKEIHIEHFSSRVAEYGDDSRAVDQTRRSQRKRFEKVCEVGNLRGRSLLDVGCGLGDLYDFLEERGIDVSYTGIDVTPSMIRLAKEKHPAIAERFRILDIMTEDINERFDYAVAVGVINLPLPEDNHKITARFIERLYGICNVGIAVSMTSSLTRRPNKDTFYYDPARVLKEASSFCQNIRIDHTYLPHDFTIFCYKRNLYS